MGLEVTTDIEGLVASNPTGLDSTTQGNDHLQLIKNVLKITFPGVGGQGFAGVITASEAELNFSVGLSSNTQAQLDTLDAKIDADILVEQTAREDADTLLGIRIDDEESARIAGDNALSSDISSEAGIRSSADVTLQNNINTEITNRTNADNALQAQLDILSDDIFPVGVRMLFDQASVPAGWTQDVSNDDRMMRVVNGSGGGVGGSVSPISFNSSHVHTTGSLTLSEAQIPSHSHTYSNRGTTNSTDVGAGLSFVISTPSNDGPTGNTGGGGSHNHGNTGTGGGTFSPKYVDIIVGARD